MENNMNLIKKFQINSKRICQSSDDAAVLLAEKLLKLSSLPLSVPFVIFYLNRFFKST